MKDKTTTIMVILINQRIPRMLRRPAPPNRRSWSSELRQPLSEPPRVEQADQRHRMSTSRRAPSWGSRNGRTQRRKLPTDPGRRSIWAWRPVLPSNSLAATKTPSTWRLNRSATSRANNQLLWPRHRQTLPSITKRRNMCSAWSKHYLLSINIILIFCCFEFIWIFNSYFVCVWFQVPERCWVPVPSEGRRRDEHLARKSSQGDFNGRRRRQLVQQIADDARGTERRWTATQEGRLPHIQAPIIALPINNRHTALN